MQYGVNMGGGITILTQVSPVSHNTTVERR